MPELIFILDPTTGTLTAEGDDVEAATSELGEAIEVNCGRPVAGIVAQDASEWATGAPGATKVRLARVYTGSVVDGPGKRSVIQMQGCSIRCAGCYVPETHDAAAGFETTTTGALDTALSAPCDGITYIGGEPTNQPEALLDMVRTGAALGVHQTVYTGYTIEGLVRSGKTQALAALVLADVVIDGPFIKSKTHGAGLYRGSSNQRLMTGADVAQIIAEETVRRLAA
jgi:anaerobic ribonucleoside-triphosphate reductase activating protein